jgi:hypothetical protein
LLLLLDFPCAQHSLSAEPKNGIDAPIISSIDRKYASWLLFAKRDRFGLSDQKARS